MARRESKKGEVLVAVMNDRAAWEIARREGWYRIPVDSAPQSWPPKWIAFYQTKVFGEEAHTVRYFGEVTEVREVGRRDLFPDEASGPKSSKRYYQVFFRQLEELPEPVVSLRRRLIVFIPTTMHQLQTAVEINDLYGESPLEEALWHRLKSLRIDAERQWPVEHDGEWYFLDFAVFCRDGKIDIETDGDKYHESPEQVKVDKKRNNALASQGWKVLRYTTAQVREEMATYCEPQIVNTVNRLGGLEASSATLKVTKSGIVRQGDLFEE
jgi:very-short-patch-repair endonuclease